MQYSPKKPSTFQRKPVFFATSLTAGMLAAGLLVATPTNAQDEAGTQSNSAEYVDALKKCQSIETDTDRLACYDTAVGRVVTATDDGDLKIIDREDIQSTRRRLFGFSLPDLGIFGGSDDSDDEEELFSSTVTSVSYRERKAITLVIADGDAVWRVANPPARLRRIKAGDTIEFKPAALGTYWLRINGQMGVKGRRVQ